MTYQGQIIHPKGKAELGFKSTRLIWEPILPTHCGIKALPLRLPCLFSCQELEMSWLREASLFLGVAPSGLHLLYTRETFIVKDKVSFVCLLYSTMREKLFGKNKTITGSGYMESEVGGLWIKESTICKISLSLHDIKIVLQSTDLSFLVWSVWHSYFLPDSNWVAKKVT